MSNKLSDNETNDKSSTHKLYNYITYAYNSIGKDHNNPKIIYKNVQKDRIVVICDKNMINHQEIVGIRLNNGKLYGSFHNTEAKTKVRYQKLK